MENDELVKKVANLINGKEVIVAGSDQIAPASTEEAALAIVANATRRQAALDKLNESDHVKANDKIRQLDEIRNETKAVFTGNKITR